VLDLACGSGPLLGLLTEAVVHVGVDVSADELALARRRELAVVRADARRLPLRDSSVDVVVMSMALMLVPLEDTLREVRRVLVPGGLLVATIPDQGPLSFRHALRWGRLLLALRQRSLTYPNIVTAEALQRHRLLVEADERRSFTFPVREPADAELLLDSLYLPRVSPARLAAGRSVVRRWVGGDIDVPLRRVVARRHD